jgi:hypothetical protein
MAAKPFNRTRVQNNLTNVSAKWTIFAADCSNTAAVQFDNPLVKKRGTIRTTTDVVTPDFRERSKRGEIIVTPYTSSYGIHSISGDYQRHRYVAQSCGNPVLHREEEINGPWGCVILIPGSLTLPPFSLFTDGEIQSAIDIAATSAWSKSNGSNAQLLVDLGEGRQTLQMFQKPMSAIKPLLRAINNSRKVQLAGRIGSAAFQTTSNLWLQYRYGIRPLVSSVNSIVKEVGQFRKKKRSTYRGKYTLSRSSGLSYPLVDFKTTSQVQETRSDEIEIRAGILLEELVELHTALGVDASGMLSLPWELVPFSFVADWFINVGDFIQGIMPSLTKSPLATWYVVRRKQIRTINVGSTTVTPGFNDITIVRSASEDWRSEVYTTTRVPKLPLPSVTWKPQAFRSVMSDLRGLDSFALALQQLGRIFKG